LVRRIGAARVQVQELTVELGLVQQRHSCNLAAYESRDGAPRESALPTSGQLENAESALVQQQNATAYAVALSLENQAAEHVSNTQALRVAFAAESRAHAMSLHSAEAARDVALAEYHALQIESSRRAESTKQSAVLSERCLHIGSHGYTQQAETQRIRMEQKMLQRKQVAQLKARRQTQDSLCETYKDALRKMNVAMAAEGNLRSAKTIQMEKYFLAQLQSEKKHSRMLECQNVLHEDLLAEHQTALAAARLRIRTMNETHTIEMRTHVMRLEKQVEEKVESSLQAYFNARSTKL